MSSVEERFWAKVNKTEGCWNWTGCTFPGGYGSFSISRKNQAAHRVSYEMAFGPIPDGMEIDHTCHERGCVNPNHLRLATHKQNSENRAGARADNRTGIRGVHWHSQTRRYRATVYHNKRSFHGGSFLTAEEAEAAVIALRKELFTHNDLDRRDS
jgi:hypothetical protein